MTSFNLTGQLRPNVRSFSRSLVPPLAGMLAGRTSRVHFLRQQPLLLGIGAPGVVRAMSSNLVEEIKKKNTDNSVIVYSKTYCPYCSEVKGLFRKLGVDAKVVELDDLADGDNVQSALSEVTGRRTVPQVFIGGTFIGGCDDTMAALKSGKLKAAFQEVGISVSM